MRHLLIVALMLAVAASTGKAAAAEQADDGYAWINDCTARNMALGADDDTAHGYCACIDRKMGNAEVNDIASWEKANPGKAAECRNVVGWK